MTFYGNANYGAARYVPTTVALKPAQIQVFVRDASLNLIGQIEDFQNLTLSLKYNDVGTWELTLPADSPGAALLDRVANPTGGVVILRNGVQLISGPARAHSWSRSGDTGNGVMTISGLDDAWILNSHLVWPDPAHTIDAQANVWWSTNASNVGVLQPAETIMYALVRAQMISPLPYTPERIVPNLISGTDLRRGYSQLVPKSWRFNTVLDALQQMSTLSSNAATGGPRNELGFSVDQLLGTNNLLFNVFLSNDRSGTVRFSFNVGNLAEAQYTTTAPTATTVLTGTGQMNDAATSGTGVTINASLNSFARFDSYYPNFYAEGFLDSGEIDPSDANAVAQLQQSVSNYWSTNAGQVAATFKAVDTTTMAFGTHYGLGDFVTVELPQLTFVERVRQIGLSYSPDSGEGLTLAVGTADGSYSRLTPPSASTLKKTLDLLHRQKVARAKEAAQAKRAALMKARIQQAVKKPKK